MPVYAELSANQVVVAPGGEEHMRLLVRNLSDTTESYVVVPLGMCSAWTLVDPPTLTLFAGEEQSILVTVRPPRSSSINAGTTALTLRVVPHGAPDETATVEAAVRVLSFDERRVSMLQPVLRARRTATYDVVVENLGNEQATCRLRLRDDTGRVKGRFDPPSVGVEPGQNASAQVRVTAKRQRWRSGTASLPFTVEAGQEAHPMVSAPATLLQAPIFTQQMATRVFAAAAFVVAAIGAWSWVVKPAIDTAATDAVDSRLSGQPVVTSPGPSNSTVDSIADNPGPSNAPVAVDRGSAETFRLAVNVELGGTGSQDYVVPGGVRLDVTDIILQNPFGDQGTVTLSRNADVLLSWNLINVLGDDIKQYVTPITWAPGDTLTLSVICTAAGNPAQGTCTPSATFSGRLVPA